MIALATVVVVEFAFFRKIGTVKTRRLALLGTHAETAASNINTLATNVASAGTDNKVSLDALAGL